MSSANRFSHDAPSPPGCKDVEAGEGMLAAADGMLAAAAGGVEESYGWDGNPTMVGSTT